MKITLPLQDQPGCVFSTAVTNYPTNSILAQHLPVTTASSKHSGSSVIEESWTPVLAMRRKLTPTLVHFAKRFLRDFRYCVCPLQPAYTCHFWVAQKTTTVRLCSNA